MMKKAVSNTQTLVRAFTVIAKRIDRIEKDNRYHKITITAVLVVSLGLFSALFYFTDTNTHSSNALIVQNGEGNSIARIEFDDSGNPVLSIDGEDGEPPLCFAMTAEGSNSLRQRAENDAYTGSSQEMETNTDAASVKEASSTLSLSEDRLDFARLFSFRLLVDKSWTHTYDTDDRKQASTVKNRDGSVWKTFQFSYSEHDLLAAIDVSNATGEFEEQWQFSYDAAGNQTEISRCGEDETVLEKWIRTAGSDGNENAWKSALN